MRKHTINVQGRTFELRSDATVEHMEEVARRTEAAIKVLRKAGVNPQDAGVLAALNLASDLVDAEGRILALKDKVDGRLKELEAQAESVLRASVQGSGATGA